MTMTFVGFKVDAKGQCYDFKSEKDPIQGCRVPVKVCDCLLTQGVNLQKEDCNKWTKYAKYIQQYNGCYLICNSYK